MCRPCRMVGMERGYITRINDYYSSVLSVVSEHRPIFSVSCSAKAVSFDTTTS